MYCRLLTLMSKKFGVGKDVQKRAAEGLMRSAGMTLREAPGPPASNCRRRCSGIPMKNGVPFVCVVCEKSPARSAAVGICLVFGVAACLVFHISRV